MKYEPLTTTGGANGIVTKVSVPTLWNVVATCCSSTPSLGLPSSLGSFQIATTHGVPLTREVWPSQPWYPNLDCKPTEAAYRLAAILSDLAVQGEVVEVPRPDEVDALAQHGWMLPGATPRRAPPPKQSSDGRCIPRFASKKKTS